MLAHFSIVPLGKGASLSKDVAEVVRLVRASGLQYRLGPMGTVVEGEPDRVFALIRDCHMFSRSRNARVYTTVTIDDRPGLESGRIDSKVSSVEKLLDQGAATQP